MIDNKFGVIIGDIKWYSFNMLLNYLWTNVIDGCCNHCWDDFLHQFIELLNLINLWLLLLQQLSRCFNFINIGILLMLLMTAWIRKTLIFKQHINLFFINIIKNIVIGINFRFDFQSILFQLFILFFKLMIDSISLMIFGNQLFYLFL